MASSMIHLYAGMRFAETFPQFDTPEFYFGCVAPDCVNLDGFAAKEVRWHAHRRAASVSEWKENLAAFCRETDGADPQLKTGCAVHILTDILWDEFFHETIWTKAETLSLPCGGESPGWAECYRFDRSQIEKSWWTEKVRPALQKAKVSSVNGLDKALLKRWQEHIAQNYQGQTPAGVFLEEGPQIIDNTMLRQLCVHLTAQGRQLLF